METNDYQNTEDLIEAAKKIEEEACGNGNGTGKVDHDGKSGGQDQSGIPNMKIDATVSGLLLPFAS